MKRQCGVVCLEFSPRSLAVPLGSFPSREEAQEKLGKISVWSEAVLLLVGLPLHGAFLQSSPDFSA